MTRLREVYKSCQHELRLYGDVPQLNRWDPSLLVSQLMTACRWVAQPDRRKEGIEAFEEIADETTAPEIDEILLEHSPQLAKARLAYGDHLKSFILHTRNFIGQLKGDPKLCADLLHPAGQSKRSEVVNWKVAAEEMDPKFMRLNAFLYTAAVSLFYPLDTRAAMISRRLWALVGGRPTDEEMDCVSTMVVPVARVRTRGAQKPNPLEKLPPPDIDDVTPNRAVVRKRKKSPPPREITPPQPVHKDEISGSVVTAAPPKKTRSAPRKATTPSKIPVQPLFFEAEVFGTPVDPPPRRKRAPKVPPAPVKSRRRIPKQTFFALK